jgi:Domain of unknown function (DUF6429)
MEIDREKIEETSASASLPDLIRQQSGLRAWKGHDWGVMNVLHEKGYISNPATKAKSVVFTEDRGETVEGSIRKALCREMKSSQSRRGQAFRKNGYAI